MHINITMLFTWSERVETCELDEHLAFKVLSYAPYKLYLASSQKKSTRNSLLSSSSYSSLESFFSLSPPLHITRLVVASRNRCWYLRANLLSYLFPFIRCIGEPRRSRSTAQTHFAIRKILSFEKRTWLPALARKIYTIHQILTIERVQLVRLLAPRTWRCSSSSASQKATLVTIRSNDNCILVEISADPSPEVPP